MGKRFISVIKNFFIGVVSTVGVIMYIVLLVLLGSIYMLMSLMWDVAGCLRRMREADDS
jgi:hypothetical protein